MNIYSEIYRAIEENKPAILCIVTHTQGSSPRKAGAKMLVFPDKKIVGTIGGGAVEFQVIEEAIGFLKTGTPTQKFYELQDDLQMHCGGSMEVYFEPILSSPKLYIFGAGHIGRIVARYALDFGFRITLFDSRPEIFEEFDTSCFQCITDDYFTALEKAEFDENTFIVIVTPKHLYDEEILSVCAQKPNSYLGMIGSKRKVAEARTRFLREKILTEEQLNAVDMPIGIPMNAETPEEIAISIIAQLINVKNSRK
jgi:xanthine dehydrogenase accessory factor